MTLLLRPVMKTKCSIPASRASSTTIWMMGRSTMVSISLGIAFVAGRKRVPRPATGKTAFLMRRCILKYSLLSLYLCRSLRRDAFLRQFGFNREDSADSWRKLLEESGYGCFGDGGCWLYRQPYGLCARRCGRGSRGSRQSVDRLLVGDIACGAPRRRRHRR